MSKQILPSLSKEEYEGLKSSIAKYGVLVPIELDEQGNVLDGHHRLRACQELEISNYPTVTKRFKNEEEKQAYIYTMNLARRQLSPEQLKEIREGQKRLAFLFRKRNRSQKEIASLLGVTQQLISIWLNKPDTNSTNAGDTCISSDLKLKVPKEARKQIYARNRTGESQEQVAADFHITQQRVSQIVQKERLAEEAEQRKRNLFNTTAKDVKYKTLIIDPPWPVQKILRKVRPKQDVMDYLTMTIEEIGKLPIGNWADPNGCHVYLWVTHKYLPEGLGLFQLWDIKYECIMTWVKNVGFTPFSWMYSTEHVLFGRIGSLAVIKKGLRLDFKGRVREHSRKPDEFYELVRQASPEPRLDFFSREARDGFDQLGDEIDAFIC